MAENPKRKREREQQIQEENDLGARLDFLLNRGINWKKSKKLRVIFKDKNDKDNFPNLLKRKLIKNIKNFKKI